MQSVLRPLAYFWALPTTLVGVVAGGLTVATGGRGQLKQGVLEFHGGFATWYLDKVAGANAMTLGHVIIGLNPEKLDSCRNHEHAHVGQVERWGVFYLPAYGFGSLYAWLRKRHYYWDNPFEIHARRACGEETH